MMKTFSTSRRTASRLLAFGLLVLGLVLSGCSSGSSGGGAVFNLSSLSGTVRGNGTGLSGVVVSVGMTSVVTDASGNFILPSIGSISSGQVLVEFDGSGAAGGTFPVLDVTVPLQAGVSDLVMPNVINLPDLAGVNSASQTVMLDAAGATLAPIAVSGLLPDIALDAPQGTIVTIGGAVGAMMVDLNITPVPTTEIPMPLPAGLVGGSFVTIQPPDAAFSQVGTGLGLDVTLPNGLGLPIGTLVDIWSFDHAAGDWVNRSLETGQQGAVIDLGGGMTDIQAPGAITEGGWHAPVLPVDPACATTFTGHVIDDGTGLGIEGASIGLSTGQFGSSDSNGQFTILSVPAYDAAALAANPLDCFAAALTYEILLPPSFGSGTEMATVLAGSIVTGGTTDIGDRLFTVPAVGSVAGIITGTGASPGEQVMLIPVLGGATVMITPDAGGSFFLTNLAAGDYLASFQFEGPVDPAEEMITIAENQVTTFSLQFAAGVGARDILVRVFLSDDNELTPLTRVDAASVVLQGMDAGSSVGLIMTTDVNGEATFMGVDGPFTVTASKDILSGGSTIRLTSSVVGLNPADDVVSVLMENEPAFSPAPLDANISGTVANMPVLGPAEVMVVQLKVAGFQGDSIFNDEIPVAPVTGAFAGVVPSGFDLDAILVRTDFALTSVTVATLIQTGIAQTTPGGTIVQDFDYASPNLVPWGQPVSISFTGVDPNIPVVVVQVDIVDPLNGFEFEVSPYFGPSTPFTLNLPDLTHVGLTGYGLEVLCGGGNSTIGGRFIAQARTHILSTTPGALVCDLVAPPALITPSGGELFTVPAFESLNVAFIESPSGAFGNNGINQYSFESELGVGTPPAGIDQTCWEIFFAAGVQAFAMPKTPLPMFAPTQSVLAGVGQIRFSGVSLNFNTLFDGGFEAEFSSFFGNVTGESTAVIEFSFGIQ